MKIELTLAQAAEFDNELWKDDDDFRAIPELAYIGELGTILADPADPDSAVTGYAMAHPSLTWEDEVILHFVLDERAAQVQAIKDAPQGQRAGMRRDIRVAIRQDARKAARIAAREDEREDAREDNRLMRVALRKQARVALREEERRLVRVAEREAAGTP